MDFMQCQRGGRRGRCVPPPSLLLSLLLFFLAPGPGRAVIHVPENYKMPDIPQPPQISGQPEPILAYYTDDITLTCEASGTPTPIFRWEKDGMAFDPSSDPLLSVTPGSGTISVASSDGTISQYQGNYSCYASNHLGTAVSNQVQLITENIPILQKEKLIKRKVTEGESIVLTCNPPNTREAPLIHWMDNSLRHIKQNDRVIQGRDGNLYFSNVIADDSRSDYACHAQYIAARTILPKEPIVLTVSPSNTVAHNRKPHMVRPTGTHSSSLALKGRPFELECIPQGLPTPSIQWVRKDGELSETRTSIQSFGRVLQFSSVLEADGGEYQCLAKNNEGTAIHTYTVSVEAAPYWTKQPENDLYMPGDSVELACEADGVPTPTVTWSMNGVRLSDVDPDPRRSVQGGTLILKDVKLGDTAVFQCEASNVHGTILVNVYVYVLELPPQILTDDRKTYRATEGQTALLECKAFGSPRPKLKWVSDHSTTLSEPRVSQLNTGALQIQDVSRDDSGSFKCSVPDTELSIAALLEVLNRTVIVTPPQALRVQRGHQAALSCHAQVDSKLDPPQFQWRMDGQKLFASSTEEKYIFRDHALIVSNVQQEDAGEYTCEVITALDKAEAIGSITVVDRPEPPSRPDLLEKHDRRVLLSWTPGEDNGSPILDFVVEFEEQKFGAGKWEEAIRVPGTVDKAEVPLQPFGTYHFRVIAVNDVGRSIPSEVSDVHTTPPAAPESNPEGVRSESVEPDMLVITWEEMKIKDFFGPEFQYKVMWRKAGGHQDSTWEQKMATAPPVTVADAGAFTAYEIKVQAINQKGEGPEPSPVLGHSGEDLPLEPPMDIGLILLNSTAVRVNWAPAGQESVRGHLRGYKVRVHKGHEESVHREDHNSALVVRTRANEETALLEGLQPFSPYTVTVAVFNSKGNGPHSDPLLFRMLEGVPSKPTSLRLDSPSETEMTLYWTPPAQVHGILMGYQLAYHQIGEGSNKAIHLMRMESSAVSHINVENLDPHSHYVFSLRAFTSAGEGDAIVKEGATLLEGVPPTNINVTTGETSANISWVTGARYRNMVFHIYHRKTGAQEWTESEVNSSQSVYELHGLEPGSKYQVHFRFGNNTFWKLNITTKGQSKNDGVWKMTGGFATEGWFIGIISALVLLLLVLIILCSVKRSKGGKYSVKDKEAGQVDSEARPIKEETFGEYRSLESDNEEKQTTSQTSLCVASKVGSEGNLMQYAHGVGVDSHNRTPFADQYSDPGPELESQDGLGDSSPVTSATAPPASPGLSSSEALA